MRIKQTDGSIAISDLPALNARTGAALAAQTRSALIPNLRSIDVDLSQTDSIDSHGLGALVALHRALHRRAGRAIPFRLRNPAPPARQLIELTRLHHLFEIVHDEPLAPASRPIRTR